MGWSGVQSWLEKFVRSHAGLSGAVHRRAGRDELKVVASFNHASDEMLALGLRRGRGAAGLALERNAAIFTRRALKADAAALFARPSPTPSPFPRAIVALPVHDPLGEVRAVVEIAFPDDQPVDDEKLRALDADAGTLPEA